MQLNKNHRESLLNELQKAQEDKDLKERCLNKNEDLDMVSWWEIEIFLATKRIKLIEKSLIDNEIDF